MQAWGYLYVGKKTDISSDLKAHDSGEEMLGWSVRGSGRLMKKSIKMVGSEVLFLSKKWLISLQYCKYVGWSTIFIVTIKKGIPDFIEIHWRGPKGEGQRLVIKANSQKQIQLSQISSELFPRLACHGTLLPPLPWGYGQFITKNILEQSNKVPCVYFSNSFFFCFRHVGNVFKKPYLTCFGGVLLYSSELSLAWNVYISY